MELRVLNYFLAIAREENMTRAAQLLHVSQPALSRQMGQLEEELGVRLFVRGGHRLSLTEDGLLLKRRAQELLALADKTKADFLHRETELAGEIAVGSGEFRSGWELARAMVAFRREHPLVRFRLYSGNGDNVLERIERGILDLGLVGEPADIGRYGFAPMPQREEWGVLVREGSPLAQKGRAAPQDLAGLSLVVSSRELYSGLVGWFGGLYDKLEIAASGNLLYNEAMLVAGGLDAVLCIRLNCTYEGLRFLPLEPAVESGTALVWKKDAVFSRAASAFIEFTQQRLAHA